MIIYPHITPRALELHAGRLASRLWALVFPSAGRVLVQSRQKSFVFKHILDLRPPPISYWTQAESLLGGGRQLSFSRV